MGIGPLGTSAWLVLYASTLLRKGRLEYWTSRVLEILGAWASLDVFWLGATLSALATKLDERGVKCFQVSASLETPWIWVALVAIVVQRGALWSNFLPTTGRTAFD